MFNKHLFVESNYSNKIHKQMDFVPEWKKFLFLTWIGIDHATADDGWQVLHLTKWENKLEKENASSIIIENCPENLYSFKKLVLSS